MTVRLPAWLQAGGYNAEMDRSVATGLLLPNSPLSSRGGVRRWAGDELQVVANNPATMQVIVKPGMAWVQGAFTSTQGTYAVVNDDNVTLTVASAPTTGARFDLVILEVLDAQYSGSANVAQLRVVTGTASSTPVTPVVGGSFIVLAQLYISANLTVIGSNTITDTRPYSAANGGTLPVRNALDRGLLTGVPNGTTVLELDTQRVYVWAGYSIGWQYVYGGTPPMIVPAIANGWYNWTGTRGGGPWEDLRATKISNIVHVTGLLGNEFAFSNPGTMFSLPGGYRPERRKLIRVDTGTNFRVRVDILPDGSVNAHPGNDGRLHPAGDWFVIDFTVLLNNNTVG